MVCALKTAAKLIEEIEIQIAGGNLLRIRSTTVSGHCAHIHVAEFFVSGRACLVGSGKLSSASETITDPQRPVTQMETAWNLRIEFRARNL